MKNSSLEELSKGLAASSEAWTFFVESKKKFPTFLNPKNLIFYNCCFFVKVTLI
jgi:hypothetical protein